MLVMRLARVGKKNAPQFRIIIQEKSQSTNSAYIDNVGTYNPLTQPATIILKEDKIKDWIGKGCQPSNTVWNMLVEKGVIEGKKRKSVTIKTKPVGKDAAKPAPAAEQPFEAAKTDSPAPADKPTAEKPAETPAPATDEPTPQVKPEIEEKK